MLRLSRLLLIIALLFASACSVRPGGGSGDTESPRTTPALPDTATPTQARAHPTSMPETTPEPPTATTSPEDSLDSLVAALPESDRGCDATPLERWEGITPYQEGQGIVLLGEGEFWVLVWRFEEDSPIQAGREVKMVWRAGTGSLRLRAVDPASGTVVGPVQGPDAHPDSSWERPGREWGTIMAFPHAGCWRVEAFATDWAAVLWFSVES